MNCGIYCITNTVNGHVYIGSSANINKRWSTHTNNLKNNVHHSRYLQNAWNKYGADCFEFAVLEKCEIDRLIEREHQAGIPLITLLRGEGWSDEQLAQMLEDQKIASAQMADNLLSQFEKGQI